MCLVTSAVTLCAGCRRVRCRLCAAVDAAGGPAPGPPATQEWPQAVHIPVIPARSLRLNSLAQLRHTSPSPYASFDIAYDGEVISHLCRCMTAGKLRELVKETSARKR